MDELELGTEMNEAIEDALGEWDDDSVAEEVSEETENVSEAETEEADQPEAEEVEEVSETEEETEDVSSKEDNVKDLEEVKKDETANQRFTLKHLDEVKEVDRDEVITLAQKGMDYDRIRTERDTLKAKQAETDKHESFLRELADMSGKSIEELIIDTKARLVKDEETKKGYNITLEQARYRVESEMKALNKPQPVEEPVKETVETPTPKIDSKALREENFKQFVKEYPDVKGADIPSEVWKAFGDGTKEKLTDLYARYENKKLRTEIAELKKQQSATPKPRSTGSRKSNAMSSEISDEDIFAGW